MDQKGENAQVLDTVKLPTCTHLDIKHDVTLRGGIKSGNFTKLGLVRDMQTCIDACCHDETCDVAFMPGHVCYSVDCFSTKLCESIPAVASKAANGSVQISHVVRGGGKGDDLEQFKKTQGMDKYSKCDKRETAIQNLERQRCLAFLRSFYGNSSYSFLIICL